MRSRAGRSPGQPHLAQPLRDLAFAALLGLLLGVAIALVRDASDKSPNPTIWSRPSASVAGYVRSDILGTAPPRGMGRSRRPSCLDSFRILRANTQFLSGIVRGNLAVTLCPTRASRRLPSVRIRERPRRQADDPDQCDLHRPVVSMASIWIPRRV
jgi:hypothetical protein